MSGSLTLEQVQELFPNRNFALVRIERGPHNARKFVWMAQWYTGYFTSDTDRRVYFDSDYTKHFGDTPGEALYKMVRSEVDTAYALMRSASEVLSERTAAVREMEQKVMPALKS